MKEYVEFLKNFIKNINEYTGIEHDYISFMDDETERLLSRSEIVKEDLKDIYTNKTGDTLNSLNDILELIKIHDVHILRMYGFVTMKLDENYLVLIPNTYIDFIPDGINLYGIHNEVVEFNRKDFKELEHMFPILPLGIVK